MSSTLRWVSAAISNDGCPLARGCAGFKKLVVEASKLVPIHLTGSAHLITRETKQIAKLLTWKNFNFKLQRGNSSITAVFETPRMRFGDRPGLLVL